MRGRPEDGRHPDEWTFYAGNEMYRVEKNGLQNIAKQDPARAGQNR